LALSDRQYSLPLVRKKTKDLLVVSDEGEISFFDVAMTVGTEAGNVITVACQAQDRDGVALSHRVSLPWYLADDANGDTPASSAPSGGTAAGTDGAIIEWVAQLSGLAVTEADGDLDIAITDTGTPTLYLVFVLPDGRLTVSGAITFA